MSLFALDGRPLAPLVQPYLGWTAGASGHFEPLRAILETLSDELFPGGIIPKVSPKETIYYAIAPSVAQRRQLTVLLRAAIGSTITDFTGPSVIFRESDSLEAVFIENGYLEGARFTAGADARRESYCLKALVRLRSLVDQSRLVRRPDLRTTGEVLRTFEMALAAHDRRAAEAEIEFLRTNLRLDAVNLGSLTVRLHHAFRDWDRIRKLDSFPSLCRTRRTPSVTNALAEAVYRTAMLRFETENDPQRAIAFFRADVLPHMGNLFDSCPSRPTAGAAKAFLLAALASTPPDRRLAEGLKQHVKDWPETERPFFTRLYEYRIQPTSATMVVEARGIHSTTPTAALAGVPARPGFEDEIEALRAAAPANLERARAGLLAATQVEALEVFQTVVAYIQRLDQADVRALLDNRFNRVAYERMLEAVGGSATPRSWVDWLARLPNASLAESQQFPHRAASEWRVHDHLSTDGDVRTLAEAIASVPPPAQERLFDTLPYMVQWVRDDAAWPEGVMRPLYQALYEHLILLLSTRWRIEAAGAARQLLDGLIQLGMDSTDYTRLLDDMGDVLPPEVGTVDFHGLMELAELTVIHSSPNPDARQRLWARIVAAMSPIRARLGRSELALVNDLGQVFGMPVVFPDLAEQTAGAADLGPDPLHGKTVAIYTLAEPAGERAKRLLLQLHPGVQVQLAHDHVASQRLEELARHADVFVLCTRSATHAATQAVERLRPAATTLYPTGKGSSSILHALEQHLGT